MSMPQESGMVQMVDAFTKLDDVTLDAILRLISSLNLEAKSNKVYTQSEMTSLFNAVRVIQ